MQFSSKKYITLVGVGLLSTLLLTGFSSPVANAMVEFTYSYSYGAVAQARSMCQANDGSYLLVGQTQATTSSPLQALVMRISPTGGLMWNKTYGGTNRSFLLAVAPTSDSGFVVAGTLNTTTEEFWLFKIDASGNLQWEQTYGGTYDEEVFTMIQTNDGGYLLTGWTKSFDTGSQQDLWMVKTYSNGTQQWTRRYGTAGTDCGYGIVQTSDGGYAVTGQANGRYCWLLKTDSAGQAEWNKTYGSDLLNTIGQKLVQANDSGHTICGYANASQGVNYDLFLAKTDSSGNMQWNKTFGGANEEFGRAIVKTNDGGYALAGYTESYSSGPRDAWIIKTDSNGNHQWNLTIGGTASDVANSMIKTSDGGYAIAGSTDSYHPTRSFLLAKVDSAGPNPTNTPTFALTTNSTTVFRSAMFRLNGTLSMPKTSPPNITLQWSKDDSGFIYSQTFHTVTNGLFTHEIGFSAGGTYQLRVVWPGDATSSSATSNIVTVTVLDVIPEFTTTVMLSILIASTITAVLLSRKRKARAK